MCVLSTTQLTPTWSHSLLWEPKILLDQMTILVTQTLTIKLTIHKEHRIAYCKKRHSIVVTVIIKWPMEYFVLRINIEQATANFVTADPID